MRKMNFDVGVEGVFSHPDWQNTYHVIILEKLDRGYKIELFGITDPTFHDVQYYDTASMEEFYRPLSKLEKALR